MAGFPLCKSVLCVVSLLVMCFFVSQIAILYKVRIVTIQKSRVSTIQTEISSIMKDEMLAELEEVDLLKQQIFELELQLRDVEEQRKQLELERDESEKLLNSLGEKPSGGVLVRKPAFKTIWMSGFLTRGELLEESWVHSMPNRVCRRYPNATVYTIRQDTVHPQSPDFWNYPFTVEKCYVSTRTGKLFWKPVLPLVPENVNVSAFDPSEQMLPTRDLIPDIHIVRNAYNMLGRIGKHAPWLVEKNVLRVAYPVHYLNQFELVDYILHTDSLLKTIPEARIEEFEKNIERTIVEEKRYVSPAKEENTAPMTSAVPTAENYQQFVHAKENFILYPARWGVRKGQLLFAQKIDPKLVKKHNITIVFAGSAGEKDYKQQALATLEKKRIPYKDVGFLSPTDIIDYYIRAKVNVLLSYDDPGPRVLYEGLYGNTPFITLPSVQLDSRLEPFGRRLKSEKAEDLNEVLEEVLTKDWKNEPISFAREYLHDAKTMNELYGFLEKVYCLYFEDKCIVTANRS